ncbi:MAG: class I SAM-dependent methyltransferase [Anaerolineales bacterium]|nr:class I SAM-dependent methyltransferase [Anaerolineales bacterium]
MMSADDVESALVRALWRVYGRPERPPLWQNGNLPWNDPDFSRRMLREHLDQSHGAASRQDEERARQIAWLWQKLGLETGSRVLDLTCGPGLYAVALARQGCQVLGIDFSPASIAYAHSLAASAGVTDRCRFCEQDVAAWSPEAAGETASFDAALFLYGQLAVFPRETARQLLQTAARALKPGGKLCVELLNPDRVDKADSTWWFTDDQGLWGDAPFLHLGERFWDEAAQTSVERFQVLHLQTGQFDEITLCDQVYTSEEMTGMMRQAGFADVTVFPAWDGLPLYDAAEWLVYVARK